MRQVTEYDFGKDLFENRISGKIEDLIETDISEDRNYVSRWTKKNPAISAERIDSFIYFTDKLSGIDGVITNKANFLKMLFWLFGLDDIFDNGTATTSDLQFLVKSFKDKDNLKHIEDDNTREIASNLVTIFDEVIDAANLTEEGRNLVSYCLRKTLYGMLLESKNSFDDLDRYLHFGKYTCGIPLIFATQLSSNEFSLEHKSSIMELLEIAGEIIRIYNDIKSYKRELGEGKNNSIKIITNKNRSFNDAVSELNDLADTKLSILKSKHTDNCFLSKYVNFLLKMINGIQTFYQDFDFHEFSFESSSCDNAKLLNDKAERINDKVSLAC